MLTAQSLSKIMARQKRIRKKAKYPTDLILDITGPEGDIFFLTGLCQYLPRQMELSAKETELFYTALKLSDYGAKLDLMKQWFGITYITPVDKG